MFEVNIGVHAPKVYSFTMATMATSTINHVTWAKVSGQAQGDV